jgi:hypothetical protein
VKNRKKDCIKKWRTEKRAQKKSEEQAQKQNQKSRALQLLTISASRVDRGR